MKKFGIFLGFAPEQPIKNQGIGRLIAFIILGILKDPQAKIVIASPAWYKDILNLFLKDQQIDVSRIELLTTSGVPYLLKIKKIFTRKSFTNSSVEQVLSEKNTTFFLKKLMQKIKHFYFKQGMDWICSSSLLFFIPKGMLFCITSILLLPFFVPYIILKAIKSTKKFSFPQAKLLKKAMFLIKGPLRNFKEYQLAHKVYNALRAIELNKLIKLINKRKDIPSWFIPTLFWPEVKAINTKKIIAAPDVVFVEFPTLFLDRVWYFAYQIVLETLQVGDHFICYSEHVRQKHLIESLGVRADKISVIPHGAIELNKFFNQHNPAAWHDEALEILATYQKNELKNEYLKDFDFTTTVFLFYSSQLRPYKNFINLIKAIELLLRRDFLSIKLILTADITCGDQTIYHYIKEKSLENDVLCFPNVPSNVLAALNHLAVCSVNPTLFEGGFPFTFTEAYSVGTPSLMSNIAVTASLIEDENIKKHMLFNPYELDDIVEKIKWAIKHREELLKIEAPLYKRFQKRTWSHVANEYVDLLNKFSVSGF